MLVRQIIIISLYLLLSTNNAATLNNEEDPVSRVRLPTSIHPTKYYLHITTRIHEDILPYHGNVTIELTVKEPTDEIYLHAKLLHDFEVSLWDLQTNQQFEDLRCTHEHKLNFLRIYSGTKPLDLKAGGQYRLEIFFHGEHQDRNFGFYKDTYMDDNDDVIPLAITQFEPTSARIAFPCFDEPHFKARFVISITHGSNYTALSNMPVDGTPIESPDTQMTTTTFLKTPIMSTYLVAFAVSNYHHISEHVNGREYRVFFPPNSKDNGSHALKNGINSLNALENYFGIEYPLPKLDHIRVEKTYGIAMENWGLITYNNKNFVTNVRNNSLEELRKIISQNHEIAHQWFGNLVSPKWWTYVWLKEGLAVYFSYIATDLVYPEKKVGEHFIENEVREVFRNEYNNPMTIYVEEESDIRRAYNIISYRYGSCFVRMFHHAIGHKTFIKGVTLYLTRFQYSVADENDLFAALQESVDEDKVNLFQNNRTASIMRSWTHNIGIPIITVTRNYKNGTITIRQQAKDRLSDAMWWIPLTFATPSNPDFERTTADFIMPPEKELTISVEDLNLTLTDSDWLIVDKQHAGLYHVIYDDQNVGLIAEALNKDHTQIHLFNRVKLFRDLTTFVLNQTVSVENLLSVIQYLKFEKELLPWENAADLIWWLYKNLHGSKAQDMLKPFIRDLIKEVFLKLYNPSIVDQSVYERSLREKILRIACEVDLSECLKLTQKLANDFFMNEIYSDSDALKNEFTLCHGIKAAAFEEFKKFVSKMVDPARSTVQFYEFVFSLKCLKSKEYIRYFLGYLCNDHQDILKFHMDWKKVRALTMLYFLNADARPIIFEFLYERDKDLAIEVRDKSQGSIQIELSWKETFQKNYAENILKWLEQNYAGRETTQNGDIET